MRQLFQELKRRHVFRVAAAYAVVAWIVIQVANVVVPRLELPSWSVTLVIVMAGLGFPLALVLAWAFEVTPEGVRRTPRAEPGEDPASAPREQSPLALRILVGLGLTAAAAAGGWYLLGGGEPEVRDRSIAVLPFESTGGAQGDQLAVGVHDDLLTRLSNVSELSVTSRTSSERYRETEKTLPQIARELGVEWIVEGGVQQAGERIRVNAQLIDAPADDHRWAKTYQRDLTAENLFAIQSELTKQIARSLQAELSAEEQERVERKPTDDLEAYRLYVEGRTHLDQRTERGLRQGAELFRQALATDSSYALAWTGLADARALLAIYGHASPDSVLPEARHAAERALSLEPDLAEAHASRGLVYENLERDGPAALRELRKAVELKPSNSQAHEWLGSLLITLGRLEQASGPLRRAVELDPTSPPNRIALASWYLYVDSLEAALQQAREAERLSPSYPAVPLLRGVTLRRLGRLEEARDALLEGRDLPGVSPSTYPGFWVELALTYRSLGDSARVQEMLDRLDAGGTRWSLAATYAGLGRADTAVALLPGGRAIAELSMPVITDQAEILRYHTIFDAARGDPRFQQIVRELNVAWGLNPDGSLPGSADATLAPRSDG